MLLALIAVLIGGAAGLAAGGRPANLEFVDFRWVGLPAVWVVLGMWARRGDGSVRFFALLLSMGCLLAFLCLNAARLPGLWLVAFGIGLNLFMTANNHGMPYDPNALEAAGIVPSTFGAVPRSTVAAHPNTDGDQLVLLGQVIPIRPLRTVVSFGDLFVAFGLGAATMNSLGGSATREAKRGARHRRSKGDSVTVALPEAVVPVEALVVSAPDPVPPLENPEILRVVALLDDGRALLDLLDLTGDDGASIDAVELSARHAVRQALDRHGLPDRLLQTQSTGAGDSRDGGVLEFGDAVHPT